MSHALPSSYSVLVSNATDGNISVFRLDAATGSIEPTAKYPAGETVMPMTFSTNHSVLYAATRGSQPSIVTYSVDLDSGRLSHLFTTPIASSLAYLSTDPSGQYLLGASYGEHSLSLYSVDCLANDDGSPLQVVSGIEHAHAVIVSPDGRFAYVSSLGSDTVVCYAVSSGAADGQLTKVDEVEMGQGFGPRHMRFSSTGKTLYVLSEFRATVAALTRNSESGRLESPRHSNRAAAVAHLNDGRARPNFLGSIQPDPRTLASMIWAADIQVTPDGKFVYISERTSSRLITYRVTADESLEYAGYIDTEIQPRGFKIDPAGRFLVACGENSSHVAVYAIDVNSGALSLLSRCEGGRGANWVEIIAQSEPSAPLTAQASTADNRSFQLTW